MTHKMHIVEAYVTRQHNITYEQSTNDS